MQRCVILLPEIMLLSWRHMLKMIASQNTEKILLEIGLSRKGRCTAWNEFWEGGIQAGQRTPGRLTEAGSSRVKLAEASGLDRQIEAKKDCSPAWRTERRLASCDTRAVPLRGRVVGGCRFSKGDYSPGSRAHACPIQYPQKSMLSLSSQGKYQKQK